MKRLEEWKEVVESEENSLLSIDDGLEKGWKMVRKCCKASEEVLGVK